MSSPSCIFYAATNGDLRRHALRLEAEGTIELGHVTVDPSELLAAVGAQSPDLVVADLGDDPERVLDLLDSTYLRTLLSGKPNGVQILAAPVHAEEAELVRGAHVERALNLLRGDFDWVILDLSRTWSEPTVRALDLADLILLVTLMDVPTLHHTRKHLDLLARLGHTGARIRLIPNRASAVDAVTDKDVADFLERRPDFRIPNDFPTTLAGVNRGVSVAEVAPRSPLARGYNELTHALYGWFGADQPAGAEPSSGGALARV